MRTVQIIACCLCFFAAKPLLADQNAKVHLDDYAPCGLVCLDIVCQVRGNQVTFEQLSNLLGPPDASGTHSLQDLSRASRQVGIRAIALKIQPAALAKLPMPVIAQLADPIDNSLPPHFVVVLQPKKGGVIALDAPYPAEFFADREFFQHWTGNVLVFPKSDAEAEEIVSPAKQLTREWLVLLGCILLVSLVLLVGGLNYALKFWRRYSISSLWERSRRLRLRGPTPSSPRFTLIASSSLLLIILALGTAILLHWLGPSPQACEFDDRVIDLGMLDAGDHLVHIPISNPGGHDLHISDVRSSCTCAGVIWPDTISAAGHGTIDVTVKASAGATGAMLVVNSDDPFGQRIVRIRWNGTAPLFLVPNRVEAQLVPKDRHYERIVRISYPGGSSAIGPVIQKIDCDSSLVYISMGLNAPVAERFSRAGLVTNTLGRLDLHVRVRPPANNGVFQTHCKIHLKYGKASTILSLPIFLDFVAGPLTPDPASLVFTASRRNELIGQQRDVVVKLRVPGGKVDVVRMPAWLEYRVTPHTPDSWPVRFAVIKAPVESGITETILIRHNESTAAVPVAVSVITWRDSG